jgi:hypothetical protein
MVNDQDVREQLVNQKQQGPATSIAIPLERITTVHGLMWDLDPDCLIPGNTFFPPATEPEAFYRGIQPVLERHPLAKHAEIRSSGRGLHAILWFEPAVELHTAGEQEYWAAIVRAVQCSLPVDPHAPGITAMTRPVGAINNKNGATVSVLKRGNAINPVDVIEFMKRLVDAPFREVAVVLLGQTRVSPCPVCRRDGSRLDVADRIGHCYGGCGKVSPDQFLDAVYQRLEQASKKRERRAKSNGNGAGLCNEELRGQAGQVTYGA